MQTNKDWLPGPRADLIAMAKDWLGILSVTTPPWGIPAAEVEELQSLTETAEELLETAKSSERTEVITAECKAAFEALTAKMRSIKNHYFLSPPLTDVDFISLQLKPKNSTHSPVPPPTDQAEADISRPGEHLIMLHLRAVAAPSREPDPHRSDYGFRIYWGIMPAGGATVENATGTKRELVKIPVSGEELPHSKFTRRKKELLDFPQEDRGKTIYFCIRYENAKGEAGPWGPLFSTIIP
ncbi:MAG: hypothetical protein LBP87_03115 [Planctomycetaceae bacterium]|jgi:hypothetical protein|nr:hypothetical protein [Planctomycetaceae bacterium]